MRDKSSRALLRWWLEQPFEYAWVHAFAQSHAWLRLDRMLVSVGYAMLAAVGAALLIDGDQGIAVTVWAGTAVVLFALISLWWWAPLPWPSERVSLGFVIVGELAGLPLAAAAPTGTVALALLSLYVLPGLYLMFLHSPQVMIAHNVWVLAVVIGTGSYVLAATDTDVVTALVLMVVQTSVCTAGLVGGQVAITFLRNDARNSFTDPLTGLLNRRGFHAAVTHSVIRHPSDAPVSLLMADIDKFKPLNDAHGHHQGDRLLVDVARILSTVCGDHADALARFGGDEFVVIAHVDSDTATVLAQRVRAAVAERPGDESPTLSIGVCTSVLDCWPPSDEAVRMMLARADSVLYSTKRSGGDAVTATQGDDTIVGDSL
ncbi:GGDEF domain-containing protein [Williamsia maris]|uniref:Diguanylate cyclase (GGDEF) domain-containing protein n=1 Tax=Williamsia maris TaxID=72806 RepID=A0ABT1HDT1_9NOCA|nr:GGDEF domain-containing protein [Williamsia maris]MCP2175036.1 diguanylate cyclase (GGDEF) domain-containing protein [Williamsia maris]